MLEINDKAQSSIEILTILGVLIVGAVILGSFYLSNINSKLDSATELEGEGTSMGDWLNEGGGVESDCGNDEQEGSEQCDGPDMGSFTGQDCSSLYLGTGDLDCTSNCTIDTSGCSNPTTCGDGVIEGAEQCEVSPLDLDGKRCSDFVGYDSGSLDCNPSTCTFDFSGCESDCGNGVIDAGEECDPDGPNLNGSSCVLEGYDSGNLACNSDCTFDESGCYECGDGVVNGTEDCDSSDFDGETCASLGFDSGTLNCTTSCEFDTTSCVGGSVDCLDGFCDVNANECNLCSGPGEDCEGDPACAASQSFILKPFPLSGGTGIQNVPYEDFWLEITLNDSSWVDLDVNVVNNVLGFPSSACSISGTPIPATGLNLGQLTDDLNTSIECSSTGVYKFIFSGVDELASIGNSPKEFIFNVDTGSSEYALCGLTTNLNGSLDLCVNNLESSTSNSNGSLDLYVNNPDLSEHNSICSSSSNGSLCLSIGQLT